MSELTIDTPQTGTTGATGTRHGSRVSDAARYLTFSLAGETYALDILDITEIIEFRTLTVVPMMPSFVRGVINLRGRVLPVVDLASRFGQPETEVARRTGIIVVHPSGTSGGASGDGQDDGSDQGAPGTGVGIMVDMVNKVVHLAADEIEPPPSFGAGIRADFISGMARHEGQFMIVLDIGQVLSLDEMVQLAQAAQSAQSAQSIQSAQSAQGSSLTIPDDH